MENLITVEMIKKNENQLKGRIFTQLQLNIIKKKLRKEQLNTNEKTYYYKYIKPKLKAMLSFFNIDEINFKGKENIITERIPKAIRILSKIKQKHKNKKIMISGSFLFNRDYHDIDAFIFTKYNKEDYNKGKLHVNFLPETTIDSLFFNSLSQISISNFSYTPKKEFNIELNHTLKSYELLVNQILNEEEYQKELRTFLLEVEYTSKGVILNPKQLYDLREKTIKRNTIKVLSNILINTLILSYEKKTLNQNLKQHIKDYKGLLNVYKSSRNLKIYIQTYKQVMTSAA
ncbi:MAG: hypothetical protein ISS25_01615 [Nanoarchaeota archaeon]|nr:hypothetical protein [DPANN group archaeon]MBL7116508.1 hypothetical protein [Nanoarchaeota archaeon]